jgi:hypothetical protein
MIKTENMDGSSANEQLVGKFHVTTVENLPVSTLNNHDDSIPQTSLITDEPGCTSRFQMIRVDRNFGRGRWKVNDYEPPENTLISTLPPVHTMENEPVHIGNNSTFSNVTTTIPHISASIPAVIPGDLNVAVTAPVRIFFDFLITIDRYQICKRISAYKMLRGYFAILFSQRIHLILNLTTSFENSFFSRLQLQVDFNNNV